MWDELLPCRMISYCRCHELKCSAICFQFQIKPNVCHRQYHRRTISLVGPTMTSMSFAIISMRLLTLRYCIRCMQHHSRIELLMVAWPWRIFTLIITWHRTSQYMFIQSWYYNLSFTEDGLSNGYWHDNGTVPPYCLRSADSCSSFSEMSNSNHVASAVWFLFPSPVWSLLLNCRAASGSRWHQLF